MIGEEVKMRQIAIALILSLAQFGLFFEGSSFAEDGRSISNAAAEPSGLRVEWLTQIATGVRGSLADVYLNVNENKTTTYFELSFALGREVISENDMDAFDKPRGIEGAQEFAELRKEIIQKELDARNLKDTEVKIEKFTLPETSLYTITSDGHVTAIDADTGRTRWMTDVGNTRHTTAGIGANNDYVAAVLGTNVYCLEAETGKILFTQQCRSSPASSPAASDEYVYVPLTNGRVEVFSIEGLGIGSQMYVGSGRAVARPLVTEKSVSWPTTAGHLNVAKHKEKPLIARKTKPKPVDEEEKPKSEEQIAIEKELEKIKTRIRIRESIGGITYRMRTDDEFVSAATYKSGMLFVCSLHGFVYAVDEAKGTIVWQFSTGDEIETSPIPIGDSLYVVTTDNFLYKLNAKTGAVAEGWPAPIAGIRQYVSASKDKLFVQDTAGRLVMLDQKGGQRLGQVAANGLNLVYQNSLSDRIYVGNRKGLLQCLREVSSRVPYFHSADFVSEIEAKTKTPGAEKGIDPADADDPFAGFDTADEPADTGDENPFGGEMDDDDNPFGGGAVDPPASDPDDENPFGGGDKSDDKSEDDDNPFGGGV